MNITAEHLQHMAARHHATMKKLDGLRDKFSGWRERLGHFTKTAEVGAGAWLGGTLEGKTAGASIGPVPINLGIGLALLGASHFDFAGKWGDDLQNAGNGFVGSWAAATGYAFGKRWKESGKAFGGGGHPWAHPYENGWPHSVPAGPPAGPPIGPPPAP